MILLQHHMSKGENENVTVIIENIREIGLNRRFVQDH